MAVFPISTVDPIGSVETFLTQQGILTDTLYKSTIALVFTNSRNSKVIRFDFFTSAKYFEVYVGDSWTSGTTLVNSFMALKVQVPSMSNTFPGSIVVTPKVFGFIHTDNTAYSVCAHVLFGKVSSEDSVISYTTTSSGSYIMHYSYTLDTRRLLHPINISGYLGNLTQAGAYVKTDLYFTDALGELIGTFDGASLLCRPRFTGNPGYMVFGDDIVTSGGFYNNQTAKSLEYCILIENGNI
jgi:hypothetical protein